MTYIYHSSFDTNQLFVDDRQWPLNLVTKCNFNHLYCHLLLRKDPDEQGKQYFHEKLSSFSFSFACLHDKYSPTSFGTSIIFNTDSAWHFDLSCWLKLFMASFQFVYPSMMYADSMLDAVSFFLLYI